MQKEEKDQRPVINCHTHIFTGDHVPPWLAKTFLPWPAYFLVPLSGIVSIFRWWFSKGPYAWKFKPWYKKIRRNLYTIRVFLARNYILAVIKSAAGLFLTLHAFFILYDAAGRLLGPGTSQIAGLIGKIRAWLTDQHLLFTIHAVLLQIAVVVFVLLFIPSGRNLIFFVAKKIWSFFRSMPGKQSRELIRRYLNIGRFAFHRYQSTLFAKLRNQYPQGTGFVILPMDMEYMAAGRLKVTFRYYEQMKELAAIKKSNPDTCFPFIFADPRRIKEDPAYFSWQTGDDGRIKLNDCHVKKYIEQEGFSGIKIYPALGYYPFDEALLPLWKYAADNGIPVLTHCIRGTIYYRGTKKKQWDRHPVFEQAIGNNQYEPLLLAEKKNAEFTVNFTHPLNYLCLLEESLLRRVVGGSGEDIKKMFGYKDPHHELSCKLDKLKICFGHFGGDDEWRRFFEKDRDNFSSQLVKRPGKGIDFFNNVSGQQRHGKMEQLWKYADWYSITCSMMLRYEDVYADISYILHDSSILPLLKKTLDNPGLRNKVLYGTDFYVVRNHKSDKNMLADMLAGLTMEEFDDIARNNPANFLNNRLIPAAS